MRRDNQQFLHRTQDKNGVSVISTAMWKDIADRHGPVSSMEHI